MNDKLRIAVLALPILGLAACTSMDERSSYTPPAPVSDAWLSDADRAYMDKVERVARRRGVDVTWVNLPRSRQTVAQVDD
ncbi:hypothetical protein [Lysobacter sp. D1-1-M9]|uniref:hypothetical protein n=1 Tax=Novilysobacter longmucuonensis TaxID=3098603 RepID=UPI002FCB4E92